MLLCVPSEELGAVLVLGVLDWTFLTYHGAAAFVSMAARI
jgi:hypothetical protein